MTSSQDDLWDEIEAAFEAEVQAEVDAFMKVVETSVLADAAGRALAESERRFARAESALLRAIAEIDIVRAEQTRVREFFRNCTILVERAEGELICARHTNQGAPHGR